MTEATLAQMVLVEPSGTGTQISPRQIRELVKMGLASECTTHPLTWHTDLKLDEIDQVLAAANLIDCGFCGATATHEAPTRGGNKTLAGFGRVRLLRLHLCGDCALLVQTGDHALLEERYTDSIIRLNREVRPAEIARVGEQETRRQLRPAIAAAMRETFDQIVGTPKPLPAAGGFVVIGDARARA